MTPILRKCAHESMFFFLFSFSFLFLLFFFSFRYTNGEHVTKMGWVLGYLHVELKSALEWRCSLMKSLFVNPHLYTSKINCD